MMLPMSFPDKRAALLGAFCNRFLIGLFAATTTLPLHPVAAGALIGFLLSLPDAIITKAYAPIMVFGWVRGLDGSSRMSWFRGVDSSFRGRV